MTIAHINQSPPFNLSVSLSLFLSSVPVWQGEFGPLGPPGAPGEDGQRVSLTKKTKQKVFPIILFSSVFALQKTEPCVFFFIFRERMEKLGQGGWLARP